MYEKERDFCIELVQRASSLSLQLLSALQTTDCFLKEDGSPVTVADFTLQAFINHQIATYFPKDQIMGEEDSMLMASHEHVRKRLFVQLHSLIPHATENGIKDLLDLGNYQGGKERFWAIDPIDGTRGFIRKEQYAIACSLIENGEVVLGVVGCPHLIVEGKQGTILSAIKGEKTQMVQPKKRDSLLLCEPQVGSKTHSHEKAEKVARLLDPEFEARHLDSQSKYALVATQIPSMYMRIPKIKTHREKVWDHAAGMMIVEGAGGYVSDLEGKRLDFSQGIYLSKNWGLLASHGISHERVLAALHEVLDES